MKPGDHVIEAYDVGDREPRTAVVQKIYRDGHKLFPNAVYVLWDDHAHPRGAIFEPGRLRCLAHERGPRTRPNQENPT